MIISRNPLHIIEPQSTCLICLEETSYSRLYTFPCNCKGHFHNECLQTWFTTHRFRECPLCRKQIPTALVQQSLVHPLGQHIRRQPHIQIYIDDIGYSTIHSTIPIQQSHYIDRLYISDLFQNDITWYKKCCIILGLIIGFIAITIGIGFPFLILYLLATNK